ncbi:MAG: ACP S-malonyltransferase [Planctomycetota bacterium]|nr:ACP S-malonyltransferase [Planctomycetota bacterium]
MAKVALLFPGQGAQAVGMAAGLLARSERARDLFTTASEILGYDLAQLCIGGPDTELNLTSNSQPALFVHSAAALADFYEQRPEVSAQVVAVAGLSLGEYSALYAAGALGFENGVSLVAERGRAMQSAASTVSSQMASVIGLDRDQVQSYCDQARRPGEILQLANLLCPGNIAISGHTESMRACETLVSEAGYKFIRLAVAGAFHTDIMQSAVEVLQRALEQAELIDSRVPLVANVDAQVHDRASAFAGLLPRQIVSPVLWEASLRKLLDMGVDQFYEIGTGRVLTGTLKRTDRKAPCEAFGD